MTLTVLALNVNSPSRERAKRQLAALTATSADVLVLTEVKCSDGGEVLVNGLKAHGYSIRGWASRFDGFTTLIASHVPLEPADSVPGRIQSATLTSTPAITLLGAYGISSDPFGRNTADKVDAKRQWLQQFAGQVRQSASASEHLLVVGDLNVVDDRPARQYRGLYDFEKNAYADLLSAPLSDLLRNTDDYSWTTHQGLGFRYDHALSTEALRPYVLSATLDHQWRLGEHAVTDHSAVRVETSATYTRGAAELQDNVQQPTLF